VFFVGDSGRNDSENTEGEILSHIYMEGKVPNVIPQKMGKATATEAPFLLKRLFGVLWTKPQNPPPPARKNRQPPRRHEREEENKRGRASKVETK